MSSNLVTIKDIAAELGISASTVSRALKDHPDISEETKKKVIEIANRTNYRPNAIALSLRNKKSNIIGILVPQIVHHFFSSVISGIDKIAYEAGYNVLISQSNESFEREKHNAQTLMLSRVDGILASKTKETIQYEHFNEIRNSNIPLVFFDRKINTVEADGVIVDDKKASFEATEYLIKTGCKNIIHLKGPESLTISKNRLEGYKTALQKYGLAIDPKLIIESDTFDLAYFNINRLLEENIKFDGVFSVNDLTALGAISALKHHNIAIPEQVSIIGFTNGIISRMSDPPLSTIEQNGFMMGSKAAEILIERITNGYKSAPMTEIIPTELILRGTTRRL